jgi:hypothetical protein
MNIIYEQDDWVVLPARYHNGEGLVFHICFTRDDVFNIRDYCLPEEHGDIIRCGACKVEIPSTLMNVYTLLYLKKKPFNILVLSY